MAKNTEFKKSDLLKILSSPSASLKEKNRAVKLLRKFDPNPKKHLDSSFQTNQATVSKYPSLQSFLCWRCDKIKQTMTKVKWESKEGQCCNLMAYTFSLCTYMCIPPSRACYVD
ncbi:uncharacterized protein BcabD6B2_21980 [Babesia caballi]|uniref:Uncharacterized protein n=1 Tax=Babesia caballi TaxID=5871 RepID=A0AAV4LSL4_BABCB|nr:hypothetical protein BcabD6B2_21980 [Babesia caballi]